MANSEKERIGLRKEEASSSIEDGGSFFFDGERDGDRDGDRDGEGDRDGDGCITGGCRQHRQYHEKERQRMCILI